MNLNYTTFQASNNLTEDPYLLSNPRRPGPVRNETRIQKMGESASFYFKDRRGHFDWRALSTVDVDRVMREVEYLLFCD